MILLLMAKCVFAAEAPTEINNAIKEALNGKGPIFNFKSFEMNKKIWGFDGTAKLSDIKAGAPFQIYTVTLEKFEYSEENAPVCSLITPGDWMVPLYVNGELMQTLLLISDHFGEKEKWSAGVRSAKGLAQAWEQIKNAWPERLGYHPEFIMIHHAMVHKACFFVPEKGEDNLTVFGDYYLGFTLSPRVSFTNLTPSSETLRSLRSIVKDHERKSDSLGKIQKRIDDSLVQIQETKTAPLWKEREIRDNESVFGKGDFQTTSSVTSWWMDLLMPADSAIIPANFKRKKPDLLQLKQTKQSEGNSTMLEMGQAGVLLDSQIIKTALPLRVGVQPIDKIVTKGQDHWYVLFAEDGAGYIRIGATGPMLLEDAPFKEGQAWGPGGMCSGYDGPKSGADLTEISQISGTQQALRWRVKTAYLKIRTTSSAPVSYRISFVSELPENRIGCPYDPGVVSQSYILAVANLNTTDLYHATRIHYTAEDAFELRKKLFQIKDHKFSFMSSGIYKRPDALDPEAEGRLHVQHIILEIGEKRWAFVIICERLNGLWLVVNASRDPDLSDSQISDIVERDFHKQHMARRITND
jgi:hypothetical protein